MASRVAGSAVVASREWAPSEVLARLQGLTQLLASPAPPPAPEQRLAFARTAAAVAKQPTLLSRDVGGLESNLAALAEVLRLDRCDWKGMAVL